MSTPTRIAAQVKTGAGSVSTLSFTGVDVQAGDLLIVKWTSYFGRYATSVTDTGGNTWVKALDWAAQASFQAYAQLWYTIAAGTQAANVVTAHLNGSIDTYGAWLEVYRPDSGGAFTFVGASKQWISDTAHDPHELSSAGITIAGNVLLSMLMANGRDGTTATNVAISPGTIINRAEDDGSAGFSAEYFGTDLSGQVVTGGMGGDLDGGNNWCYEDFLIAPFTYTGGGGGSSTGTLNATLGDATASAAGTVKTQGTLGGTLAAAVLAAAGIVSIAGSGGGTLGNATLAAAGTVPAHGTLSQTLGAATASGSGAVKIAGSLAQTFGAASVTASGTVISGRVGQLNATLADAALSGSGTVRITGAASNTLAAATGAGAGAVRVSGVLAATLANATLTASGASTPGVHGALNVTLAPAALSAHGTLATHGALAQTLAGASLTGSGTLAVRGSASLTLDPGTGVAFGAVPIAGHLNTTLAPATLAGTGRLLGSSYPADPLYYIQLPPRTFLAAQPVRAFCAAMPTRSFYAMSDPNMTPTFSSLDPRETEVLTFDASNDLDDGETLTSIEKVEVTVRAGAPTSTLPTLTDPLINGSPVALTVNGKAITIAAGCCVQVVANGGTTDCQYLIAITCNTSNPDKVLVLKGILPVNAQ